MKVFVAGATGVVGRRTVARLVAAGAEVTGAARSARAAAVLSGLGARPARVSLFDAGVLAGAVAGHEAVINLATSIPTGDAAARLESWEDNHRIRREGSRHLVDAALAAGATRYVQESIALLYADGGDALLEESAPVEATWITGSSLEAEAQAARFTGSGGAGIALRFGYFYGPDSGHTIDEVVAARAGIVADVGPASAYRPEITTDDAAAAVVAAVLRAPSGVYNVVDDHTLPRVEYFAALARAVGIAPPAFPATVPEVPAEFAALQRSQRVVNQRFVTATGWRPRHSSVWEGWEFVAREMGADLTEVAS
jgi:nucleoside-diphosphate-sugar epimerase